jgi:tripartite-type tricarboxylate transporter receptor subunit TctC
MPAIWEAMMSAHMAIRQGAWRTLFAIAGLLIGLAGSDAALAQAWPTRTVTVIVPFGAGSASDVMARVVMNQVSKQVGQPIIIENRGGAGGTIGSKTAAQATPDGYTILATGALGTAHGLFRTLPYATLRDFTAVVPLGSQPLVLVSAPSRGFKTLSDLIAAAKAKPGALNFVSAGVGSASHLAAERLRISANFDAKHIPFKGAADALTNVLAGQMDFMFVPLAAALPLIKDGKLVALAVSASRRAALLPEVPTTTEAGLADSAYDFWVGLFLPAKTPNEIVIRLHNETAIVLQTAAVQELLAKLGVEPMPMSTTQFDKYFRDDVEANVKLVKAANIPMQN